MAQGIRLVCEHCSKEIEAWDDGNPYYVNSRGNKKYAYHPSREFERCIGNDSPHLCLDCGEQFMVDSRVPSEHCVECQSTNIVGTFNLAGHRCPECKLGVFQLDPNFCRIS